MLQPKKNETPWSRDVDVAMAITHRGLEEQFVHNAQREAAFRQAKNKLVDMQLKAADQMKGRSKKEDWQQAIELQKASRARLQKAKVRKVLSEPALVQRSRPPASKLTLTGDGLPREAVALGDGQCRTRFHAGLPLSHHCPPHPGAIGSPPAPGPAGRRPIVIGARQSLARAAAEDARHDSSSRVESMPGQRRQTALSWESKNESVFSHEDPAALPEMYGEAPPSPISKGSSTMRVSQGLMSPSAGRIAARRSDPFSHEPGSRSRLQQKGPGSLGYHFGRAGEPDYEQLLKSATHTGPDEDDIEQLIAVATASVDRGPEHTKSSATAEDRLDKLGDLMALLGPRYKTMKAETAWKRTMPTKRTLRHRLIMPDTDKGAHDAKPLPEDVPVVDGDAEPRVGWLMKKAKERSRQRSVD